MTILSDSRSYLSYALRTREYGTMPFLCVYQAQGRGPDTSGGSKNVSGSAGSPLKRGDSGSKR